MAKVRRTEGSLLKNPIWTVFRQLIVILVVVKIKLGGLNICWLLQRLAASNLFLSTFVAVNGGSSLPCVCSLLNQLAPKFQVFQPLSCTKATRKHRFIPKQNVLKLSEMFPKGSVRFLLSSPLPLFCTNTVPVYTYIYIYYIDTFQHPPSPTSPTIGTTGWDLLR